MKFSTFIIIFICIQYILLDSSSLEYETKRGKTRREHEVTQADSVKKHNSF